MKSFWHPLSTILLTDPACWATPALLRMFLPSGGSLALRYSGDRMWPAVRHGHSFTIDSSDSQSIQTGDAVLVDLSGVPDLMRVVSRDGDSLSVVADADIEMTTVSIDSVLGKARLPRTTPGVRLRASRRIRLDCVEALCGQADATADPAESVLAKYDAQASFYARGDKSLEPGLHTRVHEGIRPGGKVLVVGSGAGSECFALARDGFSVIGVDFSPAMVTHAQQQAGQRELNVEFQTADIRRLELESRSLDGILFTYDVYSFLPSAPDRIATLRLLRAALRSDGTLLLSARRRATTYQSGILTLQWLAARARGEWGCSHTRWIGTDGTMHRSFVHVFPRGALSREIQASGFQEGTWSSGHVDLRP